MAPGAAQAKATLVEVQRGTLTPVDASTFVRERPANGDLYQASAPLRRVAEQSFEGSRLEGPPISE